jgi:hypothetical protein
LADETAILVCGIYVDLNQIRAGEANTPEESCHTSAYDRIVAWRQRKQVARSASGLAKDPLAAEQEPSSTGEMPADDWLCPLALDQELAADVRNGGPSVTPWRASDKGLLSMTLEEYLSLLDWTGREIRADQRNAIPAELAPILQRLHVRETTWIEAVEEFDKQAGRVVGRVSQMIQSARRAGRRWFRGIRHCDRTFT